MKSVTVQVKDEEFDRFLKLVSPGDAVILTDGKREYMLESAPGIDLEEDSEELGNEILKALRTPTSKYSHSDLEEVMRRVRGEKSK